MDHKTARTACLTLTDAAIASAWAGDKSTDELTAAASKAIADGWVEITPYWAEVTFDMWIPSPGARFAGRFISFMARYGGPECGEQDEGLIPNQIVIMTIDEGRN